MNKRARKGIAKHGDFIIIDIICLQLCFVLSYWFIRGFHNPYSNDIYQYQAIVLTISQLFVILFANNYQGILRRRKTDELINVVKFMTETFLIALIYLYLIHRSAVLSRLQIGFTSVFFILLDFGLRLLNKQRIYQAFAKSKNKKSLVLITSRRLVPSALEKLNIVDGFQDFFVSRVIVLDETDGLEGIDVPVEMLGSDVVTDITRGWVDEAFILQPADKVFPLELIDALMEMGITVNFSMEAINDPRWPITDMRKLGGYKVLTSSVRFASASEMAIKRAIDILGGIVGCIITGILYLFIAPAIYAKSPGPIFFKQERVGLNGKTFMIYKFRSMYLDAEERKAALMAQNNIKDGMMFKMDDDPRIIGSEKKDKNGKPRGIGNFIRKTSLDEFPQFYNILRGEMSLVGTRPPTMDEWKKYEVGHRIRMSIKPGLTGMWQVSGRSKITDFDEVVRLDREYIESWSIWLDIKILLKTVWVVLTRKGAE